MCNSFTENIWQRIFCAGIFSYYIFRKADTSSRKNPPLPPMKQLSAFIYSREIKFSNVKISAAKFTILIMHTQNNYSERSIQLLPYTRGIIHRNSHNNRHSFYVAKSSMRTNFPRIQTLLLHLPGATLPRSKVALPSTYCTSNTSDTRVPTAHYLWTSSTPVVHLYSDPIYQKQDDNGVSWYATQIITFVKYLIRRTVIMSKVLYWPIDFLDTILLFYNTIPQLFLLASFIYGHHWNLEFKKMRL